jgi:hypothetical protein
VASGNYKKKAKQQGRQRQAKSQADSQTAASKKLADSQTAAGKHRQAAAGNKPGR